MIKAMKMELKVKPLDNKVDIYNTTTVMDLYSALSGF